MPDGCLICEVDYASEESLQKALQGQDAVVSTIAGAAVASQKPLIDAAIAAGVKHFIPADYAMSVKNPDVRSLPPYTDVKAIEDYLRTKSDKIDWTVVACGGFLEYVFDLPFVIELGKRKIDIINGGEVPFSVSEFGTAAKAVAGVLRQPERVVDHGVQIHAATITQKGTLGMVKKYDTNPHGWTVNESDADVKFEMGLNMLKRGELTMEAVSTLMAGAIWGGKYKAFFEETDNQWLGVDLISQEKLEEIVKNKVVSGISGIASDQIVTNYWNLDTKAAWGWQM